MTTVIKRNTTQKEIKELLAKKRHKKKSLSSFAGKLKRNIDGLAYQKEVRNEWS